MFFRDRQRDMGNKSPMLFTNRRPREFRIRLHSGLLTMVEPDELFALTRNTLKNASGESVEAVLFRRLSHRFGFKQRQPDFEGLVVYFRM